MGAPGTGSDASTSFQVLTVTAAGVPVWTDTIDGGTFQNMDAKIVISTLQKKISELTLINVMMEAQIADLQSQLNSMNTEQQSENDLDGNENQAKEIDNSGSSTETF